MKWTVREVAGRSEIVDEEGAVVAECWDYLEARLIAAAPELLAELKEVHNVDHCSRPGCVPCALISRIEGER